MDNEMNYNFDAKFKVNILVLAITDCGKTIFVQNLGKNKMFGKIEEVMWISKVSTSKETEKHIKSCFAEMGTLMICSNCCKEKSTL